MLYLLDASNVIDVVKQVRDAPTVGDWPGQRLCCAMCKRPVTSSGFAQEVNQQHQFIRSNPQGQTFEFRCFSECPGCDVDGAATTEHSWFTGCAWQFAHCRHCHVQLGWFFSGSQWFFGLVSQQIIECDS